MARTSAKTIEAIRRQVQAVELRMAGRTLDEIATAVGYASRSGASYAINAVLKRTQKVPAEEYRSLNIERLNKIIQVFWPGMVTSHDEKAAGIVLRTMAEQRQLLGLGAPEQVEGNINVNFGKRPEDHTDEELTAIIEGRSGDGAKEETEGAE